MTNRKLTVLYSNKDYTDPKKTENCEQKVKNEPEILEGEVENITKKLKNKKAPGHDKIPNKFFKMGGDIVPKILTRLFNKILKEKKIPKDWKRSDIILIFEKGERDKINNYRPISLSSSISKIFAEVIEGRIKSFLIQPKEQAGFWPGYSTTDHLHAINQLIEKCNEYQVELHLAFVDFAKAIDSLNHKFLLSALKNQGVPEILSKLSRKCMRG